MPGQLEQGESDFHNTTDMRRIRAIQMVLSELALSKGRFPTDSIQRYHGALPLVELPANEIAAISFAESGEIRGRERDEIKQKNLVTYLARLFAAVH